MSTRRLATEHVSADESPGLLLWQVTNRWQAAQRAALKPLGLTHVQFVLLASLTWLESDGPVTQRQLADHAVTDPMMTSQVLRALEQRALIRRADHPDDKRAVAVTVTPAGAELANRANVAVEACDRAFFSRLGPAVGGFAAALRTLARREKMADEADQELKSPGASGGRSGRRPAGDLHSGRSGLRRSRILGDRSTQR